jgi:hypothetical protein
MELERLAADAEKTLKFRPVGGSGPRAPVESSLDSEVNVVETIFPWPSMRKWQVLYQLQPNRDEPNGPQPLGSRPGAEAHRKSASGGTLEDAGRAIWQVPFFVWTVANPGGQGTRIEVSSALPNPIAI